MSNIFIQPPQFVSAFEVSVENPRRPWRNPFHMHSHTEVCFILDGEGEFIIDQTVYRPRKGDLIVHYPLVEHQESSAKDSSFRAVFVLFKGLELSGKPKGSLVGKDEPPLFHLQEYYEKVDKYLMEMLDEYHQERPGYVEVSSSLLQTVLLLSLRIQQTTRPSTPSAISSQVKAYIEEHFREELTLNDLADLVHVSPYHLAHVFKEEVGVSPIQYLIKCRIEKAKEMLIQSDLSVSDISAEVGYPNANYFNILFKKVTNENPGKFRSRRKSERGER